MADSSQGLVRRVGPFSVDIPRSAGYYGGVALAVTAGLVEPPLGIFIASVPFLRMLNRPSAPKPARVVGELMEGMSKPVGGDGEGTVRIEAPGSLPAPARRAVAANGHSASRSTASARRRPVSANGPRPSSKAPAGRARSSNRRSTRGGSATRGR